MRVSRKSVYSGLLAVLWTFCGAITMASFFFISFFPEYSPFAEGEIGFSVIFAPLAVSFMVGLLANEHNVSVMILLSISIVFIAAVIAFLAVYAPILSGIVSNATYLPSTDEQRMSMVFSTLFIIPLTVIGTVLGKAVGGVVLPSEEELIERKLLIERTREWHERMARRDPESEKSESTSPEE
ncbi:MAG: hypothetical protein ACE5QF_01620 [Thermoplasmata archaeon]